MTTNKNQVAKAGPEPTLISRKQVDALYEVLAAVTCALNQLEIPYIVTGGSLLGAIRQHSILFCDDDIDLAILGEHNYDTAKSELQSILGANFKYSIRPWEGGDKVRLKRCSNVFLDVFCIRRYSNFVELNKVIGVKKNGEDQSCSYVAGIMSTICKALYSQGEIVEHSSSENNHQELPCPIWHFNTRKAIELWPKEVYRDSELYPLTKDLKMGPILNICGPHTPLRLLKRAFGEDCFDVYYQSMSHGDSKTVSAVTDNGTCEGKKDEKHNNIKYPPHISAGGQWTQSTKTPLSEEHYIPMQSMSRAKRRFSTHCKKHLFEYLEQQTDQEIISLTVAGVLPRPRRTVYLDGVFDLFHIGHLKSIEQCAALGDRVIIGITGDKDAMGYKRLPIVNEHERTAIVQSLEIVDHVVCPCPLLVTKEFMDRWGIDLVVHGFADKRDREKQIHEFFKVAVEEGKFQEINYYNKMSTTDIIRRIKSNDAGEKESVGNTNPNWFGAALAAATDYSSTIPFDPFPLKLRGAVEMHIQKARDKQAAALNAVKAATTEHVYNEVMSEFMSKYGKESLFRFATKEVQLREEFLKSCGLGVDFDIQLLHESAQDKDEMLFHLASDRLHFQEEYDRFVRRVCIPYVASFAGEDATQESYYYQSFPCIRIVKPGEFSIGPHGDATYGHHPSSINVYVPLTKIEGSASLFLESRPGSEDWHPIVGEYGMVKFFAGAICKHFTPENHGDFTRVSLDFRILPGNMYSALKCGGSMPGGVKDVYRQKEGYYTRCFRQEINATWERDGVLLSPDARCGFPWTKVNRIRNK